MSRGLRVVGIDPGTRVVGYGALDLLGPSRFRYVECGTLKVDGRRTINHRLDELSAGVAAVFEELGPSVVAIESAYSGRNHMSALKLAEARGAFKLVAIQAGLPLFEYAPARIKRAVVGKGRATKVEVAARVGLLCGLARRPTSDAADALAVAICHAQTVRLHRR